MTEHPENIPAYRTIRMAVPEEPVAALADVEAWRARDDYPDLRFAGGPVFGVAREREQGGWELYPHFSGLAPQEARDSMGSYFRRMAAEAEEAGDAAARDECMRAAERMDWEALDDMTVRGTRFRVVRADRFLRTGPLGPEPPRPSDPDACEAGMSHREPDPADGFVVDPVTPTGLSEGILKMELLTSVFDNAAIPPDVRAEARRAASTHPGGVMLPATFMTSWDAGGHWLPEDSGTARSPQGARDSLAMFLRVMVPFRQRLDPAGRARYNEAADRLDEERLDEIEVAGRRYRITRVERLVRFGPDGPEGPRPSDHDSQPPVMVQASQDGTLSAGEAGGADEDAPIELDPETQRFADLFREEEERRRARREGRG